MTAEELLSVESGKLKQLYNIFYATGHTPKWIRKRRVSLIPKKPTVRLPSEYRPITVTSLIMRVYHGIITRCLEDLPLGKRQKAYLSRDGIAKNTFILNRLIMNVRRKDANC